MVVSYFSHRVMLTWRNVNQEEREKVVNQGFASYRKRRIFGKWEPSHIIARPEWWSEEVLESIRKSMLI